MLHRGILALALACSIVGPASAEYTFRPFNQGGSGIGTVNGIVKGDGAGNPSQAVAGTDYVGPSANLTALLALSSTGFAVRTGSNTWAQRTVAGTTNEICVTNGDGVSGNPTFGLCSTLALAGKTITGAGFSAPPGSLSTISTFLTPGMSNGQQAIISLGNSAAANNGFYFDYNHNTTAASRYFSVQPNEAGPGPLSLALTAAGNVGIGTVTPGTKLEVSTTSGALVSVANFLTPSMSNGQQAIISLGSAITSNNGFYFDYNHNTTAASRYFSVQPNEAGPGPLSLALTAAGNVGIGTVTPTYNLDVASNQNNATSARVSNTSAGASASAIVTADNGTNKGYFGVRGTGSTTSGVLVANDGEFAADQGIAIAALGGPIKFASGSLTEQMRLTSTGLGIGTTSPSAQLHTTSTVRFAGISGVGTSGCLGNDTSGNVTGGNPCSGTGFPSGGVKGDLPFYSAAGTGAATKASDANIVIQGGDPSGAATSTAAAVLAYGYSKRVVLPPAPGGATGTYKFSTDVTFPIGTELIVPCGVTLAPDVGKFVRNLGVTKSGQCTIVGGAGTTYLGRDVRADWWPSTGGDDALAINAADASTTEAASAGADGFESIIRLACKTYTAKTPIILHASSTNAQQLVGCGDATIIDPSSGTFARGVLTQAGQTAGGGSDLMSFVWRDFAINCSADQNVKGIALGTTGNAIRSYTKNVIERVRVSNCRTGIFWTNTRLVDLIDTYIGVRGDLTATAAAIQMDFDDTSQFNGDSDIIRGQFVCADATHSGGTGYGLRMKSDVAGSNTSGIRVNGAVFYYCNKMVYGTWSSTGTMGDHFFMGGSQCEQCGNIADYAGSTGTKKAAMLRFENMYATATSGRAQPYFRFAGGNTDEIVDVLLNTIRIRGGGACASCRFVSLEFVANAHVVANQLISFEGSGGNPNEIVNMTAARKVNVNNNVADPDGISGTVPFFATAGSSSTDIFVVGNNARSAVGNMWNASSVTNPCVANNLPSASSGC